MEQVISSDMVFKVTSWDFPGGPEIKTLHLHCRRCGFNSSQGTKILHTQVVQPKFF